MLERFFKQIIYNTLINCQMKKKKKEESIDLTALRNTLRVLKENYIELIPFLNSCEVNLFCTEGVIKFMLVTTIIFKYE